MDQIMVVRMLRILRFVRALRVVKQSLGEGHGSGGFEVAKFDRFGTVWKLVRGLLTSFDAACHETNEVCPLDSSTIL